MMSRIMHGDYAGAEDVVQEAFTRAWKFYPAYDPERGPIEAWFNGILFNSLRDYQREKRGSPTSSSREIVPEDIITTLNINNKELRDKVKAVVNRKHKRVLELFFMLGYTSTEISQMEEGMTVTNVTTIVNRFREDLMSG